MSSEDEREIWRRWWADATPEQREWAKSVSGEPLKAHELLEDDEGMPAGVRTTGGRFPRLDFLFDDQAEGE